MKRNSIRVLHADYPSTAEQAQARFDGSFVKTPQPNSLSLPKLNGKRSTTSLARQWIPDSFLDGVDVKQYKPIDVSNLMQIGRIQRTEKKKRPETPLKDIVVFEKKVLPFHENTLKSTV